MSSPDFEDIKIGVDINSPLCIDFVSYKSESCPEEGRLRFFLFLFFLHKVLSYRRKPS